MGIVGATPEIAQQRCRRSNNEFPRAATPCRCTGPNAVAVYGPYVYTRHKPAKDEWYLPWEYPYEGSDGSYRSRDGMLPTP